MRFEVEKVVLIFCFVYCYLLEWALVPLVRVGFGLDVTVDGVHGESLRCSGCQCWVSLYWSGCGVKVGVNTGSESARGTGVGVGIGLDMKTKLDLTGLHRQQ